MWSGQKCHRGGYFKALPLHTVSLTNSAWAHPLLLLQHVFLDQQPAERLQPAGVSRTQPLSVLLDPGLVTPAGRARSVFSTTVY